MAAVWRSVALKKVYFGVFSFETAERITFLKKQTLYITFKVNFEGNTLLISTAGYIDISKNMFLYLCIYKNGKNLAAVLPFSIGQGMGGVDTYPECRIFLSKCCFKMLDKQGQT